jgi:hypothetical protein
MCHLFESLVPVNFKNLCPILITKNRKTHFIFGKGGFLMVLNHSLSLNQAIKMNTFFVLVLVLVLE